MGSFHIAAIADGRTLIVDDGRELRLAGIEIYDKSKAVLQSLAEGRTLHLKSIGTTHDRYGRFVGFAYVEGVQESLQAKLLEQGAARVSAGIGDKTCAQVLLAIERQARESRRGLWADSKFEPLPANNLAKIRKAQGHFVLVEGKVLSVRQSGATIYLNFRHYWSRGFSAAIPRRLATGFLTNGIDLMDLEGRRIRVRGWIEQGLGFIIAVNTPEQIEILN